MNSAATCRQTKKSRLQFGVDKADGRYGHGLEIPESCGLFTVSYELLLPNPSEDQIPAEN